MSRDALFLNGDGVDLTIRVPAGALLSGTLEWMTVLARLAEDGELLRFSYQPAPDPDDPDAPPEPRRAARLLLEPLPTPESEWKTCPACHARSNKGHRDACRGVLPQ